MNGDENKDKSELMTELVALRQRVAELEARQTEHQRTQEALRHSEERYRTILEEMQDGYYETDLAGNLTFFNDSMCQILGYSRAEMMGMNYRVYTPKDEVEAVYRAYNTVYRTDEPLRAFPYPIVRKGGSAGFAETSVFLITNEDGEPVGYRGIRRDITERKRVEDALTQSESKYRLLAENTRDVLWAMDMNLRSTYVSPSVEYLLGYTAEEAMSKSLPELLSASSIQVAMKALDEETSMEQAEGKDLYRSRTLELEQLRKDGSKVPVEVRVAGLRDAEGRVVQYLGVSRDITERKQAEEKLQESERRYRDIVENMRDALIIHDLEGKILDVSDSTCELFGYERDKVIGEQITTFTTKESIQRSAAHLKQLTEEWSLVFDSEAQKSDGSIVPVNISAKVISKEGERLIQSLLRDITERKQMDDALRGSEEKYRTILDEMEEGYFEMDLAGNLTFFNDSFCRQVGYSRKDLTGLSYRAYVAEEDIEAAYKAYNSVYRTGKPVTSFVCRVVRKNGLTGWVESSFFPRRNRDGETVGFRGVGRDITERKKAEEALRESEQRYKELFEGIDESVMVYSRQGQFVDCNQAALNRLGYSREEFLGLVPADIVDPAFHQVMRDNQSRIWSGETTVVESAHRSKDGRMIPVEINARMIQCRGESAILAVVRDITEPKRVDEELRSSREQLRGFSRHLQAAREQERAAMAREIHDELGQALTALKMDVAWLRGRLPEGQEPLLNKTESMSGLIDATAKTVRRLSSELRPGLLDDLGIVAAVEWQTEEFQDRTGIRCQVGFDPEDIALDQDRSTTIFRILQETLTNVARHSKATRVKVSLKQKDTDLVLRVRDNGNGIAPDKISAARSFGLMGIRERADLWGGDVKISGVPDKGTTVITSIPLEERKADDKDTRR